jgi:cytochrome b
MVAGYMETTAGRVVRVWDPVVRLFHWTVVAGCAVNMVLDDGKLVHRWVGYAVALALAIRLVWGLIGTRHARFTDFVPGWTELKVYIAAAIRFREPRHLGHNPLGAVMILALMAMLAGVSVTGWMMTLDRFWGSHLMEEIHESFANGILLLAAVHVLGVLYGSLRHGENLIRAMVTGLKRT